MNGMLVCAGLVALVHKLMPTADEANKHLKGACVPYTPSLQNDLLYLRKKKVHLRFLKGKWSIGNRYPCDHKLSFLFFLKWRIHRKIA